MSWEPNKTEMVLQQQCWLLMWSEPDLYYSALFSNITCCEEPNEADAQSRGFYVVLPQITATSRCAGSSERFQLMQSIPPKNWYKQVDMWDQSKHRPRPIWGLCSEMQRGALNLQLQCQNVGFAESLAGGQNCVTWSESTKRCFIFSTTVARY